MTTPPATPPTSRHRRTRTRVASVSVALFGVLTLAACAPADSSVQKAAPTARTSPTTPPAPTAPTSPSATDTGAAAEVAPHWSYRGADGPARWGSLSDEFRACSTGTAQSPIDLPAVEPGAPLDLTIEHGTVGEDTADTGHTVQMTFLEGETTRVDGVDYTLRQMHFHAESEHTVEGRHHPVEFHFVHADAAGNLMVIGVFGVRGASNSAYDAFVRGAASDHGDGIHPDVNVGALLPADHAHWSYDGSLTTPPCTEGVKWVVLSTPVELGADQLRRLRSAYDRNHRPTQPLDDRTVLTGRSGPDVQAASAGRIATTILPVFAPRMRSRNASTVPSIPSRTVSSNTTSPFASHGPIAAANSGKRSRYPPTVKPRSVSARVMRLPMLSGPGARPVSL